MMLGETMCFGAYFILKYGVNRADPDAFDGYAKPCNPMIMLPVSIDRFTNSGAFGRCFMDNNL